MILVLKWGGRILFHITRVFHFAFLVHKGCKELEDVLLLVSQQFKVTMMIHSVNRQGLVVQCFICSILFGVAYTYHAAGLCLFPLRVRS